MNIHCNFVADTFTANLPPPPSLFQSCSSPPLEPYCPLADSKKLEPTRCLRFIFWETQRHFQKESVGLTRAHHLPDLASCPACTMGLGTAC